MKSLLLSYKNQSSSENHNDKQDFSDEEQTEKGSSIWRKLFGALKWVEQQEECDNIQLLSSKCIRMSKARNRVSSLKQKGIFKVFS